MNKFLSLALLLFSVQSFARPEIAIPASVEVSQRELLRLSDIATVKDGTPELLSFMESVVIREDARELLLSQKLPSSEILTKVREAMKSQSGLRALNPAYKIPSQVAVAFASTPISREEIQRKVLNHLQVRCNECEYKVSIQSTPAPAQKQWDLDFTQLTGKGGFLLPLRDGDQRQLKWISGTIRVSQLTPVASRLILQGERVQQEDVRMVMTDVTFAKDNALRLADIQGQLAARSLPVGTAIWSTDLKREPAAKKGQIVKALLGDEGFEISVNMQAEDNGFVGDLIKVKNLDNQKVLSGVVIEKGVVKLQ